MADGDIVINFARIAEAGRLAVKCARCGRSESAHSGSEKFCPIIATWLPASTPASHAQEGGE